MGPARKLLLGLAVLSIASGAWMLSTLTGLGAWFAVSVGSAAAFVLAGSNLVAWAFGSRRVDGCADEDLARLAPPLADPVERDRATQALPVGHADGR